MRREAGLAHVKLAKVDSVEIEFEVGVGGLIIANFPFAAVRWMSLLRVIEHPT